MSDRMEISDNEHGQVRLFLVDLPADRIRDLYDPENDDSLAALKAALGADHLDPEHVELFPVSDLDGVGLSAYLVQGHGVAESDISADGPRLDGLKGHILILTSRAFDGVAQTLTPRAPIRWLATYGEASAARNPARLASDSAHSQTIETASSPAKRVVSDAAMSGRVATVALIVMFALMGMMIWIAG